MKLLLTTIAAVLLVGCGESQQSVPQTETKPESSTAKAPDISIHDAAELGDIEAIKKNLAAGADVNAKDILGCTPLYNAAFGGHKEIAELLIDAGADVNAKDEGGETPLDWAILLNHTETADLLRKHGGKYSTINMAALAGDIEAIKEFLAAGSDVNAKDESGETPLDAAIDLKQIKTADFLLKHGGKTGKELKGGEPVGDIEAIKEFLARKERDMHIWFAVPAGNIEVVKQYLDAGADVNAMGGLFEWTLLHEAANVSQKEIVELLIAEGADVNANVNTRDVDGETPLDVAIHPQNSFNTVSKEIADLLRKHGGKTSEELK